MGLCHICSNGYWAINGQPIYVPDDIDVAHDNIVTKDSGRLEDGYNRITWVRPDIRTVTFSYNNITGAEVAFMRSLTQGKVFELTYFDNGVLSMVGYVGKQTYSQKNLSVHAAEGGLYKDYKFTVVEM